MQRMVRDIREIEEEMRIGGGIGGVGVKLIFCV